MLLKGAAKFLLEHWRFSLKDGHRSSQCSRKKTRELGVLLVVSRESRPKPIKTVSGCLASFCVKRRGVKTGDFVTLIRGLCQKAAQ